MKQLARVGIFVLLLVVEAFAQERVETFLATAVEVAREQINAVRSPSEIDLERYIKPWADQLGVTESAAKTEIEQWVAKNLESQDLYRKGLAHLYRKEFLPAAQVLAESVARHSETYKEMIGPDSTDTEETREIRLLGVRDLRLIGHATFLSFSFADALQAYRQAFQFVSADETPELWAEILLDLGQTFTEAAARVSSTKSVDIYKNAVKAFSASLEVLTVEAHPEKWGQVQNSLGATMAIMGLEAIGEKADSLFSAAAAAFRNSLTVFSKEATPILWAKTQNNLGATLSEFAVRTGDAAGAELMRQAVAAFNSSLEVRKRESTPRQWAALQKNLATAYAYLKDWPNAAKANDNVLQVFPDDAGAYRAAADLYQKFTFDFERAFQLSKDWVARHPDDLKEKVKLAEKYFTTARFSECQQQIVPYLASEDFSALVITFMRVLDIANQVALKNTPAVPQKLDALLDHVKSQRQDFKIDINFAGLIHFARTSAAVAPHQSWLVQFFEAAAAQNRDLIAQQLETARAAFAG